MNINKDKFIKVKKFKTAVKHLSKLVQKNDGDLFYISDVIYNYQEGIKKFHKTLKKYPEKTMNEIIELIEKQGTIKDSNTTIKNFSTPWEYHESCKYEDSEEKTFFRINIVSDDEYWHYIDCAMLRSYK